MSKIKKGILFTAITALLIVAITLTVFLAPQQANASGSISLDLKQYTVENLTSEFDSIGYDGENTNRIIAHKTDNKEVLNGFVDVSLIDTEKVRTAYDTEYVPEEDMIYLAVSTFDENDVLLNVEVATAYPIRYEDGSVDAMFDIDGTSIQLSEILTSVEDCFAISLVFGIFSAAKIVAAIITTAKVAAVITGVVTVGYATYKVVSMSKERIQARERESEKERKRYKKNPRYYYKATRRGEKLLIAANPDTLMQASKNMQKYHTDYWSAIDRTAFELVIYAFGNFRGPEYDHDKSTGKIKEGYYEHYHPKNNYHIHSFFGRPYAGKY